jgi:hypothetical protein
MDAYETLRQKAAQKRDEIIAAARTEYQHALWKLRELRRTLNGQDPKEMLEGSEERPLLTPSGIWLGNYPTLKFDLNRFERNLRRVTLGLFYLIRKQPFPATGKIGILGQLDQQTKPLIDLLEANFTPTFDFGDDVFEWRFMQTRWGFSAWKLAFYRSVVFYALAFETPVEELEMERTLTAP